ncbi:hypothetical protein OG21DRAFT_1508147 [Imleria badia]|nr:hypothetical protein OG21DRAFT_1508147 [Imleria badia]
MTLPRACLEFFSSDRTHSRHVSLGYSWGDPVGGFIYGGLVTGLAIWHTTYLFGKFVSTLGWLVAIL